MPTYILHIITSLVWKAYQLDYQHKAFLLLFGKYFVTNAEAYIIKSLRESISVEFNCEWPSQN